MSPAQHCWHLVECSYEIRRTLLGQTSGMEVGMCILGYRTCFNGGIRLNRLIDKELPESGPIRRLRLEMIRRQTSRYGGAGAGGQARRIADSPRVGTVPYKEYGRRDAHNRRRRPPHCRAGHAPGRRRRCQLNS
jgi:hypothetical protein